MNASPIYGIVEGFYGRPWSLAQRCRLFQWMQRSGLNTYFYSPKDDFKHRSLWRELYDESEATDLRTLIAQCCRREIRFIYGVAPGLDFRFKESREHSRLEAKIRQLLDLGCRHFALLYDDLEVVLGRRLGLDPVNVAREQAATANRLLHRLTAPEATLIFCPTQYCARKAVPSVNESEYLRTLGRELESSVGILWTGPEIVSETITVESLRELREVIRRKPILWDNLHANDYDLRRLYLGPYSGRPPELRDELAGILSNPNCEFEANFVAVHTLGAYARAESSYDPRQAYQDAVAKWREEWQTAGAEITADELQLLGDCLYLPFGFGPAAQNFISTLQSYLTDSGARAAHLRSVREFIAAYEALFRKMPSLTNRDLFHSLLRHAWELNEELQLLENYLAWIEAGPLPEETFVSPDHAPGIYRGGFAATLQRLLPMDEAGVFSHRQLQTTKAGADDSPAI